MIRHHLDSVEAFLEYDPEKAVLPSREDLDGLDFITFNDQESRRALVKANELKPRPLKDKHIKLLIEFLFSLTDPACFDLRENVPSSVPSRRPVFD